jgi:hypothetical protein
VDRPLPTLSALPRAFRCLLSTTLPEAGEDSAAADAGTIRHHFFRRLADLVRGGMSLRNAREVALAEAPAAARWELALIPVETIRLKDVVAELAVAIDVTTGEARVLGRALDRRYDEAGRTPNEVAGAIDALILVGQEGVIVRDYKGRSHDRRPEDDEQLLAGALAAVRIYRRRWADLEVIRLVNGRPFPLRARVSAPDLERFGERLVTLGRAVRDARATWAAGGALPPARRGDHCVNCPGLSYCPAKMGLARAALGGDLFEVLRLAREGRPLIDDASAAEVEEALADVERLARRLRADLKDFARQRPIRRRDGRVYGPTRSGRVVAHRPLLTPATEHLS